MSSWQQWMLGIGLGLGLLGGVLKMTVLAPAAPLVETASKAALNEASRVPPCPPGACNAIGGPAYEMRLDGGGSCMCPAR